MGGDQAGPLWQLLRDLRCRTGDSIEWPACWSA